MTSPTAKRRWFHPTPSWLIVGLLVAECPLWLSERYQWFSFNQHKGWTVLIAVAAVGIALVLMLLWLVIALVFCLRFQFSVRSLLVLTVAVAIPCNWLGVEIKGARKQREILAKLGGEVTYDWQINAMSRQLPNIRPPEPAWLRSLLGDDFFGQVVDVNLEDSQVRDAGLEYLKGLDHLEGVWLNYAQSTDAGLEHIKGLNHLSYLMLERGLTESEYEELHEALPNCIIQEFHRLSRSGLRRW